MVALQFSQEQLASQSKDNAEGWLLGTISYFASKDIGLEEWIDYVGKKFAIGWENIENKGAKNIAWWAALGWVSVGASLISFSGDAARAEAELEFPGAEAAELWNIKAPDAHKLNRVFFPIAAQVGLKFDWQSEGQQFKIIFSK